MQTSPIVETGEQVLPDAVYAEDCKPRKIMLSQPWMTQLASDQALAAQRGRHTLGRQIHGVAFGHGYLLQLNPVSGDGRASGSTTGTRP
jgi:hypothetical protein